MKFLMRGLLVSLAVLASSAALAAEPAEPPAVRPLTLKEAVDLSDRQLANRALAQLGESVVAVERPCMNCVSLIPGLPKFQTLRLMLQPWMSGPPGICQADALTLMFSPIGDSEVDAWPDLQRLERPASPIPPLPGRQREVEPPVKAWRPLAETRYRAVGSVDGPYGKAAPDVWAACRQSTRFDDFFRASSPEVAAEAVRVLTALRAQAQAPRPKFPIECADSPNGADCLDVLRATLDASRLVEVTEGCSDQKTQTCWSLTLHRPDIGQGAYLLVGVKAEALGGRFVPGGRILSLSLATLMTVAD